MEVQQGVIETPWGKDTRLLHKEKLLAFCPRMFPVGISLEQ